MKGLWRLRVPAVGVALVMMTMLVASRTADAGSAPLEYTMTPTAGPVGTAVHVTGSGCPPSGGTDDLSFTIANGPGQSQLYDSNPDGTFAFDYVIPPARAGEQVPGNTYPTVLLCLGDSEEVEGDTFTITEPVYQFTPPSGSPGDTVSVQGQGCVFDQDPEPDATFSFSGEPGLPVTLQDTPDYTFGFTVTVPNVPAGVYETTITCLIQQRVSPAGQGGDQLTGTQTIEVLAATQEPESSSDATAAVPASATRPSFTG